LKYPCFIGGGNSLEVDIKFFELLYSRWGSSWSQGLMTFGEGYVLGGCHDVIRDRITIAFKLKTEKTRVLN